ncbi:hypothetical protein [Nocardioides pyridinolyticus]
MERARAIWGVGAACLALLVTATACGDEEGGAGSGSSGGWSVAGSVAQLPALEDGPLWITTADLDAVAEANGLETPDGVDDATPDWLATMTGRDDAAAVVVPPNFARASTPDGLVESTGFWWGAADSFASVAVPSEELSVFEGEDLGEPEATDPLQVATTDDGAVAVSVSDALLQDWVDGGATTLDGDEQVTTVAGALDEAGAISAVIVGVPDPPLMVGIGWVGEDDGVALVAVVYGFGSEEEASSAEAGLADGFSELGDLLQVDEVAASGSTVTVTVRVAPGRASAPYELLVVQRDLPMPR